MLCLAYVASLYTTLKGFTNDIQRGCDLPSQLLKTSESDLFISFALCCYITSVPDYKLQQAYLPNLSHFVSILIASTMGRKLEKQVLKWAKAKEDQAKVKSEAMTKVKT